MSNLPKVSIDFANGALGQVPSSEDGLLCLVSFWASAQDKFVPGKPYAIRRLSDLTALGMTTQRNSMLYDMVQNFYGEAPEGTKVYVVGYPGTLTPAIVLDKNNTYMRDVIEALNGELRGIVIQYTCDESRDFQNNMDPDVLQAMPKAQELAEWATVSLYAPLFVILPGNNSGNINDVPTLRTYTYNRVGLVVGSSVQDDYSNNIVGSVAGRIARTNVDNHIGRVGDGALSVENLYIYFNNFTNDHAQELSGKGYITFRTFTGKSGYFIAEDHLATAETDDYCHLTARRTIDKAYRIAYAVLLEKLLDKVSVNSDGTMQASTIALWQQLVINAIASGMTAAGELSDVDGDKGVECVVDRDQDVLATGKINMEIRVRPFGYARFIGVTLGFTINQ